MGESTGSASGRGQPVKGGKSGGKRHGKRQTAVAGSGFHIEAWAWL